jgi:hypothetical protein
VALSIDPEFVSLVHFALSVVLSNSSSYALGLDGRSNIDGSYLRLW